MTATLTLDNSSGDTAWYGGGAICVDGTVCEVQADPARFDVRLEPGKDVTFKTQVKLVRPPRIHHRYWLRSILLINGIWYLGTRQIVVR